MQGENTKNVIPTLSRLYYDEADEQWEYCSQGHLVWETVGISTTHPTLPASTKESRNDVPGS